MKYSGIWLRNNTMRPLLFIFFFLPGWIWGQSKGRNVEILNANTLEFDSRMGVDAKRLIGNVQMKHEDILMYCDSAYFYDESNMVDAYSNVRIVQSGGTEIRSKFLKYNGNTRIAEIQQEVRLTDNGSVLTTETMYYDMRTGMARYPSFGTITSKESILTSQSGYYSPKTRTYSFKTNVVLTNPQYTIKCDTLVYKAKESTSYFLGPTWIYGKENDIYCEYGWYNDNNNTALFSKKAWIDSKGQKLAGDSILYDRDKGVGRAYGNVTLIDSAEHMIVSGLYALLDRNKSKSVVTGKVLLKQYDDQDTLYLHADTLVAFEEQLIRKKDTLTWKVMRAYHKVKFFRTDIQGKCDSLVYSERDSLMRLYKKPVLWSEENQMTAEKINIKTGGGQIRQLFLENTGLIISEKDTQMYDQIRGKKVTGYFKDNKLARIFVEGNGQTIYFAKDKDKYIGVNKADCTNLMIYLKDNKVDKVTYLKKPDATLYPMEEFKPSEFKLKDFSWRSSERPRSVQDIFTWQ